MDTQPKGRELTEQEEKEFEAGMDLFSITKMPGWKVLYEIWERASENVGPDPRGMKPDEYQLASLAAWAISNNATEFLQTVQEMVNRADYLGKVKSGEIKARNMKI